MPRPLSHVTALSLCHPLCTIQGNYNGLSLKNDLVPCFACLSVISSFIPRNVHIFHHGGGDQIKSHIFIMVTQDMKSYIMFLRYIDHIINNHHQSRVKNLYILELSRAEVITLADRSHIRHCK